MNKIRLSWTDRVIVVGLGLLLCGGLGHIGDAMRTCAKVMNGGYLP